MSDDLGFFFPMKKDHLVLVLWCTFVRAEAKLVGLNDLWGLFQRNSSMILNKHLGNILQLVWTKPSDIEADESFMVHTVSPSTHTVMQLQASTWSQL